jgi:glycosyltransferase involved in cell wall biosynthesis
MSKKILWISNALWLKTGLSRNTKALFKEWYGKHEIIHLCQGTLEGDPKLEMYPWKTLPTLSSNPQEQHRYQQDPHYGRLAAYGAITLESAIKEHKPDIVCISDDLWAAPLDYYTKKEWSKGVNLISHITFDSLALLPESFELAKNCHTYSWSPFGEKALKDGLAKKEIKTNYNIGTIPAAIEIDKYEPISNIEKRDLRNKFGIPQDDILINFVGRNQLRKKFDTLIKALASYKKQYSGSKRVRLAIHTSWTEGWPLARLIEENGLEMSDVLTTYVCKECKQFEIKPYNGEQQNCKFCNGQKCQDSASITNGVSDDEMKYIYGISDCALSVYTSGGFEYHCAESLLNALPLATIGYSCGSTYLECPQVTEIKYVETSECNSGFIKAEPSVQDCVKFMRKIEQMDESKRKEIGRKSREWAIKKFDSKVVANQWTSIFDSMPKVDYSKVKFDDNKKPNPSFVADTSLDEESFIKSLYSGFLDSQYPDEQGMQHWIHRLSNGESRDKIISIFQQIASKDAQTKEINFEDSVLNNGKEDLFFVIKESLGDCIICLSLLQSCRHSYPDHNINIVTEPQYFDVFKGCAFIDNMIPFNPMLEQEMYVIGAGQEKGLGIFVMPAVDTQKHLNYLSNNQPEMLVESKSKGKKVN